MLALGRSERVAGGGGEKQLPICSNREKNRFNPTSATKWTLDEGTGHEGDTAAGEL